MFEKAVKGRGVGTIRTYLKYTHIMANDKLVGLAGSSRDLYDYIFIIISYRAVADPRKYELCINKRFKDEYTKWIKDKTGADISIATINRAISDIKKRGVIIPLSRGCYLYNFVDFAHIGTKDDFEKDIALTKIRDYLNY